MVAEIRELEGAFSLASWYVIETFRSCRKNGFDDEDDNVTQQFFPSDLNRERQKAHRVVFFADHNDDPGSLDVLRYESGRHLIIGVQDDESGRSKHHYLLVERDGTVRYSDCLYDALERDAESQSEHLTVA